MSSIIWILDVYFKARQGGGVDTAAEDKDYVVEPTDWHMGRAFVATDLHEPWGIFGI